MILVIDNYDSFTYNLVQALGIMGASVKVVRNDSTELDELEALRPNRVVVSPGPGIPQDAGRSMDVIRHFHQRCPVLGVCLGHQALAAVAGCTIGAAPVLMHGKESAIHHNGQGLFAGLPNPFAAGRYHSLVVPQEPLPEGLTVTARTEDGEVMGIQWQDSWTVGVQFHPESVLTPDGDSLLRNFLEAPTHP